MNWTKGEWTTETMIDGTIIIKAPDGKCPATVWDYPEAEHNAHLIAAAPDMYEALRWCSELLLNSGFGQFTATKRAQQALAKAEGK